MFDSIAQNFLTGLSAPKAASTSGLPAWDPSNPLAYYQAQSPLNLKYTGARSWMQGGGDSEGPTQVDDGAYLTSSNGTKLYLDANGNVTDTYDSPGGDSHKTDVVYKYDPATGLSTPVSANDRYQGSDWVEQYRTPAEILATVLSAGAAGAYLGGGAAAAGGGGAAGAGAGAGAAGGGLSSADLAALYGTEGYGAGMTGAQISAYDAAIASGASASEASAAAEGAASGGGGAEFADYPEGWAGGSDADIASTGQPSYSGPGTSGAGAGTDTIVNGSSASPGFWNSLASGNYGDAASAAGNYLSSPSGLQTASGLVSSYLQSNAAGKAIDAQSKATADANALQKYMYDQNRTDWAPYRALGAQGTTGYANLLKDPSSITSDPGYQFQLNQGQTAIDRSAASKGGLYSGATLKALDRYGTDYAGTKLNDALGRYGNAAQIGATGISGTQNSGTNYANQAGANTTGLGNAAAGNALLNGSIWANALNGAVSSYKQYNP